MLSVETESKLADIFLILAEGEKSVDINRQILIELDDFDPYQIFTFLDIEQKNYINSSDLLNFLQERGIYANEVEIKFIILFYDRDYDGVLSYPEFANFIQSEFSKKRINSNNNNPQQNIIPNLSNNIDQALRQLLANEIELVKKILPLLNDLRNRYDFNIHDLYHAVKNWNYIEENSLRNFFGRNKISYLESDIRKIMKRLDFNGDGKVDFCEFHAFLGFPNCKFCCPNDTCINCGSCCCDLCINDIPCFIHNCIHRRINKSNNNVGNNQNNQNENNEKNLNLNNSKNQKNEQNQNQMKRINLIPVPKTIQQRSKTPLINFDYENEDPNRRQNIGNEKKDVNIDNIKNNPKLNKNYKNNLNFNNFKNMENPNQEDEINYNFNYSNGIKQSDCSNSFLGPVSDNLVLRASPKRKYSPQNFHCNSYCSNICRSNDICCNIIYNPEPCEKCIHNHCDFCHKEIYENNENYCNNYTSCQICHNFPCCCCQICNFYPCRCKICPTCHSVQCKCCPKCKNYPCKCCPVCNSPECICCPNCKKYPCKCCPVCHLEECCCCKNCHKYPCICCPKCHFANCRCCTVCENYPCTCCPVCHMAKCICCENCKNYPCRCCPDCHFVNCQCCAQCGCYPCRCCDLRCNCCPMYPNVMCPMCPMCPNMCQKCPNCNNFPCNCCPYCHYNPCKCPGCTCGKDCIAMSLNAMNCPVHNVHTMKHNDGCPFGPKCTHEPKCSHTKSKNNNQNNDSNDFDNNSNNNISNSQNANDSNSNSPNKNNIPFNHFGPHSHFFPYHFGPHSHPPHNNMGPHGQIPPNNMGPHGQNPPNNRGPHGQNPPMGPHGQFPPNQNNQNRPNNKITYSLSSNDNNNYPYNNEENNDDYNENDNQPNDVNPNFNNGPNNNIDNDNIPYNQNDSNNNSQYNNGPNNNYPNNDNSDRNNNIPNNNSNNSYQDNTNPNQNPNENNPNNQANQNKSCPLSPISSAFPPDSPFFNADEPGQKSNWIFCPKCNMYHRCPHPGCEHNPNKRTTTHKCIHDENPNENQNNDPNSMSTPNFNNNNNINFPNNNFSFSPNNKGTQGRINPNQSRRSNKPPRKRDVFSSCPYQEELGQFVDFLGFLMEVESKIEDLKIELARRDDFNFEDLFRIFEVDGKGYIEPEDLMQGLKLLGLNPTNFDIKLLMKRFDLNQQGLLTYSDFFDMVVSFEKKLRNSVQIRPPNSCCPCKSPDIFECDTLIAIKHLFKFIIDCEREINQMRANFDSLRSKYSDVVQFLDYSRRGVINRSDLKLYLTQFNKFTNSKECDLLFIRLDKTRSGEVGIDEIENELMFLR